MLDSDGSLRPHWKMFVSMLDDLGREELKKRWEQARHLIHENGITHNVYGDPNGLDRPWSLDFVPLLLPADQWREIDTAMVQRARLLDGLLADLYGPARCIAAGLLPAELLYANPGFLRPCHGIKPPRGHRLHLYAADVVRANDGRFQVLCDRTQAPSGAGYTLENRIVLSRALPTIFRQCNVDRLAPFFVALRQTLAELASSNRENPRVVLLTPGPYNETYFEHAYLARYLGYTLVQGNDLTVRDARVFLKTLSGLQPLVSRRAGFVGSRSRRQRCRCQCIGHGCFAGAFFPSVSTRFMPVFSQRGSQASLGANVVVRAARCAAVCVAESQASGD